MVSRERTTPDAMGPALERILAKGRRAHGDLGVGVQALGKALRRRFEARFAGLGLTRDAPEAADLVARVDAEGLYLAAACEAGRDAAWERLATTYTPRLVGLAVRRGLEPSEAAELVDEVTGSLALPPPRGDAKTRMGTYLGAGTLFGWLATIVVRRMADRARARSATSLDADPEAAANLPGRAEDPEGEAADREIANAVVERLTRTWASLTPRERLALTLKYRDGLTQREAARLLGVGEPRVSRLVHKAVEKLTPPLREAAGQVEGRGWMSLRDAVRARLATLAAGLRPPAEGRSPRGARHGT